MSDLPATMRALVMTEVGPLNKLQMTTSHTVPKAGTSAALAAELRPVLVKVEYAALNPADYVLPTMGFAVKDEMLPMALGCDFAGTVAEAARGAKWAVGNRVWGFAGARSLLSCASSLGRS
jgi:NADPH:quinone reductase-like Zn-dependent oxidoreductase